MWPVSWGHQCCESPAAFGCVVVMCVVGWGRSDVKLSCMDVFRSHLLYVVLKNKKQKYTDDDIELVHL